MFRDQHPLAQPQTTSMARIWLFTDERNDLYLAEAIRRLPRGSGIIFRHYHLSAPDRRKRFETVKSLARKHGHLLLLAGDGATARRWGADGVHGPAGRRSANASLLRSVPVHNSREIARANRAGAAIFFLSPVFVTRSHPGRRPLNPLQVRRLAAMCSQRVFLLGGMDRRRYRQRKNHRTQGWAAIDALS